MIPPCILLIIWITVVGSKSDNIAFLSILRFFGSRSVSGSMQSFSVPISIFCPAVRMGITFYSVMCFCCKIFWVCCDLSGVIVDDVTVSYMYNMLEYNVGWLPIELDLTKKEYYFPPNKKRKYRFKFEILIVEVFRNSIELPGNKPQFI